jgi:N-acetylglucosaminyldiphosphoundecaprenol N-acetyl-beta-D-mannosaminyltransferase
MRNFNILGVSITLLEHDELNSRINEMIRDGIAHQIVTVNPEFIVEAHSNANYHALLTSADLAVPDGIGLILAARMQGIPARFSDRITGVDLTKELLTKAENESLSVVIVLKNNSLSSVAELIRSLQALYPRLTVHIVQEPTSIEAIARLKPQILFVTFGSPAQEFWIRDSMAHIPGLSIAIGVGGTFDFISGKIQRAPTWMRKSGFEWLWRLLLEPKRLARILRATIIFPFIVLTKKHHEKNHN